MDLKNALGVCLISLFAATLVVLIARVLDIQAASRLEPQLIRIAEELEALRASGGLSSRGTSADATANDGVVAYYFHGNTRCPTCEAIEAQAYEAVTDNFAAQMAAGAVRWKTLNYEEPSGAELAGAYGVHMPVVVLTRMLAGEVVEWKRLDRVWGLVKDKPTFASYVRVELQQMLPPVKPVGDQPATAAEEAQEEIGIDSADIPVPVDTAEVPLPIP